MRSCEDRSCLARPRTGDGDAAAYGLLGVASCASAEEEARRIVPIITPGGCLGRARPASGNWDSVDGSVLRGWDRG